VERGGKQVVGEIGEGWEIRDYDGQRSEWCGLQEWLWGLWGRVAGEVRV
jgi:hypothetical protein